MNCLRLILIYRNCLIIFLRGIVWELGRWEFGICIVFYRAKLGYGIDLRFFFFLQSKDVISIVIFDLLRIVKWIIQTKFISRMEFARISNITRIDTKEAKEFLRSSVNDVTANVDYRHMLVSYCLASEWGEIYFNRARISPNRIYKYYIYVIIYIYTYVYISAVPNRFT